MRLSFMLLRIGCAAVHIFPFRCQGKIQDPLSCLSRCCGYPPCCYSFPLSRKATKELWEGVKMLRLVVGMFKCLFGIPLWIPLRSSWVCLPFANLCGQVAQFFYLQGLLCICVKFFQNQDFSCCSNT